MVHIREFENLEALIFLKVILGLQAQLYLMLWVVLSWQRQCNVA